MTKETARLSVLATILSFLVLGLALGTPGTVVAGTQDAAVIALHAAPAQKKKCETFDPLSTSLPCSDFTTTADPFAQFSNIYLVVARADAGAGVGGMSCGLDYDFGTVLWTLCADLQFRSSGGNGEWPAPGGGNRITWASDTNCQQTQVGTDGAHALAGTFYIYSYSAGVGTFEITPNNNVGSPELAVADCSSIESFLGLGAAARVELGPPGSGDGGCNPCVQDCLGPVPAQSRTWGSIKNLYNR